MTLSSLRSLMTKQTTLTAAATTTSIHATKLVCCTNIYRINSNFKYIAKENKSENYIRSLTNLVYGDGKDKKKKKERERTQFSCSIICGGCG